MKVYLAGKITGDDNYKAKFAEGEALLKSKGHIVLSPAVLPSGLTVSDYMRICFAMIDCADKVYFLSDWFKSKGAQLENDYCQYIEKQTYYLCCDLSYEASND